MTEFKMPGKTFTHALVLIATLSLSGCFDSGSGDEGSDPVDLPPPTQPTQPAPPPVVNHPPEISGVPAPAVTAGQAYTFTPSASDADNDFLEFSIMGKPTWATFSVETGRLTGTPADGNVGDSGDITISVTDGREMRAVGPFRIRVNARATTPPPANKAPTISGTPATTVGVNNAYAFQPTAADADGDALTFSISNRPAWATFSTATGRLSGTPGTTNVATYANIVVSVSDGRVTTSLPAFSLMVQGPTNRAPTITGTPGTSVQVSQAYSFQPVGTDADSDTLTYSITNRPTWATFNTATGRLSGMPAAANVGTFASIVVGVSDGKASVVNLPAFSINVTAAPNRAPTISGTPATSVTVGAAYSFQPSATDQDTSDTLGFTIANRPTWATFDTATGKLSGTPTASNVGTTTGIIISVSDGKASPVSLAAFSLEVKAAANRAPTISGTPPTSAQVAVAYSFRANGADQDTGTTLTYSITNKPMWATFNTTNGTLSGTPAAGNVGTTSNIVITVSDGALTASLAAFSITVAAAPVVGSATLTWQLPTQNTDGSTLANLAGFRIVYGTSASNLSQTITVANPTVTTYTVDSLSANTWYFAVKAYTSSGAESDNSNVASKSIQ
jgi:hypothetical protein